MSIYLNEPDDTTVSVCDICEAQEITQRASGVAPAEWMTGQLWLDISLSEQKQQVLCFCPECKPRVLDDLRLFLKDPEVEVPAEEPDNV